MTVTATPSDFVPFRWIKALSANSVGPLQTYGVKNMGRTVVLGEMGGARVKPKQSSYLRSPSALLVAPDRQ